MNAYGAYQQKEDEEERMPYLTLGHRPNIHHPPIQVAINRLSVILYQKKNCLEKLLLLF